MAKIINRGNGTLFKFNNFFSHNNRLGEDLQDRGNSIVSSCFHRKPLNILRSAPTKSSVQIFPKLFKICFLTYRLVNS